MCPSKEKLLSGSGIPVSNNLQSHLLTHERPEREKISKMSTVPSNHKLSLLNRASRDATSIFTKLHSKGAPWSNTGLLLQPIPLTVKWRKVSQTRETHHAGTAQMFRKRQELLPGHLNPERYILLSASCPGRMEVAVCEDEFKTSLDFLLLRSYTDFLNKPPPSAAPAAGTTGCHCHLSNA